MIILEKSYTINNLNFFLEKHQFIENKTKRTYAFYALLFSQKKYGKLRQNFRGEVNQHLPSDRYAPFRTDPNKTVFPLLSPKYSRNSLKNIPNVKQTPSTNTLIMKEAAVITHPHPPSGGMIAGDVSMPRPESSLSCFLSVPFSSLI